MKHKTMQPVLDAELPDGKNWVYEVKYDGFRCLVKWEYGNVELISRNGKSLTKQFPEVIEFFHNHSEPLEDYLPLVLDGELSVLNTLYQSDFYTLQTRSRMSNKARIQQQGEQRPAHFLAFDIIEWKGKKSTSTYTSRKKQLEQLFKLLDLPLAIRFSRPLGYVEAVKRKSVIKQRVDDHLAEGIVAKLTTARYEAGKNEKWKKVKNWRTITGIVTGYQQQNDYFDISVYDEEKNLLTIGKCKHGLDQNDKETLVKAVKERGTREGDYFQVSPAICMGIHCLGFHGNELREPVFTDFRLDVSPEACTISQLDWQLGMPPEEVSYTNLDKHLYPELELSKAELIGYLRRIYPYMKPFLEDRKLTVIRYPDGINKEAFFQKNLPAYAPDLFEKNEEESQFISSAAHLAWFGNQAAIEYHIPFQKQNSDFPAEIVFDLDPPDENGFHLAVQAAKHLYAIFQELQVYVFVKTSGGKGLQVYLPLPDKSLSYEQTSRFTELIANTLVDYQPDLFTTERLKKNRKGRLYVDHVQHGPGKTIIAPYSPRGNALASVSTPLYWEELDSLEDPKIFTIRNTFQRLQEKGCPFRLMEETKEIQPINNMKKWL
ncbi:DNA ligase D [Thalassobacillus devorans]|uniref:DNA ligase D n=1 Tax=Thalassobacillus devorans TaxID=279813 RepID=UPI0004B3A0E0|nr:DNA ligase D [Thalassobacillus devorans]